MLLNRRKSVRKTTEMSVLTEMKDLEAVIEYVKSLPCVNQHDKEAMQYLGEIG